MPFPKNVLPAGSENRWKKYRYACLCGTADTAISVIALLSMGGQKFAPIYIMSHADKLAAMGQQWQHNCFKFNLPLTIRTVISIK